MFIWGFWLSGQPVDYAVSLGVMYTLSSFLGAQLLKTVLRSGYSLESIPDVLAFTLAGPLFIGLLNATLCVATICVQVEVIPWGEFDRLWKPWFLGESLGILVVAPLLLVWSSRTKINWSNRQFVEVGVWMTFLFSSSGLLFSATGRRRTPCAIRWSWYFSPLWPGGRSASASGGATTGVVLISMLAMWELIQVFGPEKKYISQSPEFLWGLCRHHQRNELLPGGGIDGTAAARRVHPPERNAAARIYRCLAGCGLRNLG